MITEQAALVARFEAFLAKLTGRLEELIAEADAGINALASQRPDELYPVRAALGALDVQIQKLTDKLDSVWGEQIEPMFKALDERLTLKGTFWDAGLDRRDDVRFAIESRWSLFKAKKEGDVLRAMWPRAATAMARTHPCSNCGAPMQLRVPYRAEAIPCSHCGTVNQLMPAPLVSTYFLNAEQVFPEEASQPQRWEIERFRTEVARATRNGEEETVESLRRWRDLERAYYQRRAEVRASILGQPIEQAEIENHVHHFEQETLGRIQAWVRSGG